MLGLSKEETDRLKYLQREYNIRQSKIIQLMETAYLKEEEIKRLSFNNKNNECDH
jgi:hypothetical protein